jgi:hypothetical protein
MSGLAAVRSVFHSEADLQHALAWQIQRAYPQARVRLEPRPRRGVRLDVLVTVDGHRTAVEVKYLLARFHGEVDGEVFDLPNQAAQDISRHDVVKDLVRVETLVADGYADQGAVLVLSNDPAYWRPGRSPETIDAAFRLHEGRMLHGLLTWKLHAGAGTTRGRDLPLSVAGSYQCRWRDYSQATDADGRTRIWRYLLLTTAESITPAASSPVSRLAATGSTTATRPGVVVPSPRGGRSTARDEILAAARDLSHRSGDGSFTLEQVLAELRRRGSRYSEATIRTHVTSRMCGDSPDHHATTFADLRRVGRGTYRLRNDA